MLNPEDYEKVLRSSIGDKEFVRITTKINITARSIDSLVPLFTYLANLAERATLKVNEEKCHNPPKLGMSYFIY